MTDRPVRGAHGWWGDAHGDAGWSGTVGPGVLFEDHEEWSLTTAQVLVLQRVPVHSVRSLPTLRALRCQRPNRSAWFAGRAGLGSQFLGKGTREWNDGNSPEPGRAPNETVGPIAKLRETPGITTGGAKKLRQASSQEPVTGPWLQLARGAGAIAKRPGPRKRVRIRPLVILRFCGRS